MGKHTLKFDLTDELCKAILEENQPNVRTLLRMGVDPNVKNNKSKYPLELACEQENAVIIQMLLEHGANVDQQFHEGKTGLHILCENQKTCVCDYSIRVFLENNAEVNIKDDMVEQH